MTTSQYKIGDIVKLKSGGPEMTVTAIDDEQVIHTVWFAGNKKEHDAFPIGAIVPANNDQFD